MDKSDLDKIKEMDGLDFDLQTSGGETPSMWKWIEQQIEESYNLNKND